ncbi:glycoside hydrolase family 2 protein [Amycolatopsis nigrescens]|uniref:glycoside hydrolase family 2 protein n=1 Tax=Amycolatopsis nigrescens TaxID=381445 RepID=UPI0003770259|nr:glycoside hydrolase family 2 TIM barrel-domain containing protein [Amycolatopsis nigrescens]
MTALQENVHPRPQLVRADWVDLCGQWEFAFDDEDRGLGEHWYRDSGVFDQTITLPYPPESELSGIHSTDLHPIVWYRLAIRTPSAASDERVLLHFGAVDYAATVWLNGILVGSHEGGHTPFQLDLTGAIDPLSDTQSLVVRAEDPVGDGTQPRGKQDWRSEPHDIWYHRTTGIWQPVWLEVVPELHLTELHWTPSVANASVTCSGELSADPGAAEHLRVVLRLGEEILAEHTVRLDRRRFRFDLAIPAARHGQDRFRLLWSPEQPVLIDATAELGESDIVHSYFGLRDVGTADGRFLLNHTPYYLRMVLQQGYWPQSHLAAPDGDALRREVELIKELGFNGVRVHQKAEDPRFLYWCDRLGLLVWGETANAYEFGPSAVQRLTREWLEILHRDRSHPSVIAWVPLNESWGVPDISAAPEQAHFVSSLYHLTKSIDPSRPVISNDGWETREADIYGVHDYTGHGAVLRERYGSPESIRRMLGAGRPGGRRVLLGKADLDVPVMLTEFGGLSFAPIEGEKWFGYSTVDDSDELVKLLGELVSAVLESPGLAGFCYTQLTDTEQETNGLLTSSREFKVSSTALKEIFTGTQGV